MMELCDEEYRDCTQQVVRLLAKVDDLELTNQDLSEEVKSLITENDWLTDEIEGMHNEIKTLKEDLEDAENDLGPEFNW